MMLMVSWFRPHAEEVTDRVRQLRPIERVEMEMPDAAGVKLPGELGGNRSGDQLARGGQVIQPFEQSVEPLRDRRSTGFREPPSGRDIRHRQDSRNDLY